MPRKIFCIIGLPGSGKSTVVDIIKKHFDVFTVSAGDIIREEIKRRGLPYTKKTDREISLWFHSGREWLLVKRLWQKIKKSGKKVAIIDGIRAPEELECLRKYSGRKPIIIAVKAPQKIRFERVKERKRFKNLTLEDFKNREKRELSYGLGELIKKADHTINNNSTLEALEKKVVKLFNKLI
jgi:dephospho-CoA kinase